MPTPATAAIYFQGADATLDDAHAELVANTAPGSTERDGDRVIVRWTRHDRPHRFVITRVEGPHVTRAAAELGDHEQWGKALARCDARFEIAIDDLDAALDEINTLIEVETALRELVRGFQHTPWNGNFLHWSELR